MIDVFLACVQLGVIFVPINILYRDREITHILGDAAPKALVTDADIATNVPVWTPAEITAEAVSMPDVRPTVLLDGDTPAGIIYTSGTTGTSKGAVLTHNNFAANTVNLLACWKIIGSRPLPAGAAALSRAWPRQRSPLLAGQRMPHTAPRNASTITQPPPRISLIPSVAVFWRPGHVCADARLGRGNCHGIGAAARLFVSGSAPLPAQVLEEFRKLYGHTILERYGMSETLMNIGNPYAGERRAGTVGFAFPGISVRLLSYELQPVADGEIGEVYLKGPNIFAGYWGREEATKNAFVDGYFKTGDLATRSADGYYTLTGRKSDLIISGGFNIYPREIEEFLEEMEEIAEAGVVALEDRVRGEVPVAFVVLAGSSAFDRAAIEARCRAKLASFKIPRDFIPVEKLPRNALGKVQKHLLPRKSTEPAVGREA